MASAKTGERASSFAMACSLLSRYVRQNGAAAGELGLGIRGEADAQKGRETMKLFPQNTGFGSEAAVKEVPDARGRVVSSFLHRAARAPATSCRCSRYCSTLPPPPSAPRRRTLPRPPPSPDSKTAGAASSLSTRAPSPPAASNVLSPPPPLRRGRIHAGRAAMEKLRR